jgi:hypothetical protein
MGLLGVARANAAVGASPETLLLLQNLTGRTKLLSLTPVGHHTVQRKNSSRNYSTCPS